MENVARNPKNAKLIPKEDRPPIYHLISGVAIAYAITCIIFIAYALLLTYTDITEKNMNIIVILTTLLAVAVAGFDASRGAKEKGWLWGLVAGVVYAIILIAISTIVTKSPPMHMGSLMILLISLAGGAIGGMLGINAKK